MRSVLTISRHAEGHTLLKSAELAPVPVDSVHHAVLLSGTLVVGHAGLGTSEEPLEEESELVVLVLVSDIYLASLASDDSVVNSTGLVSAHFTRNDLDLC